METGTARIIIKNLGGDQPTLLEVKRLFDLTLGKDYLSQEKILEYNTNPRKRARIAWVKTNSPEHTSSKS